MARVPVAEGGVDLDRYGDAALVTVGMGVLAVAARASSFALPCPLRSATGLPCPGCGLTRTADALAHAHLDDVLASDPVGALVLVAIGLLAASALARRVGGRSVLPATATGALPAVLATAVLGRWFALLLGLGSFPT